MCETCGCEQPTAGPAVLEIERDVLAANRHVAEHCRQHFQGSRLFALNLVSSPGSGKTTLIERLVPRLLPLPLAAIAGDVETELDAERLARLDIPVAAIETRGGCHLLAQHVHDALDRLPAVRDGLLFVENVGNLVCPADFDLGEHLLVVLLSAAEGHDKPRKYPTAFRRAHVVVISKMDLAPACDFDVAACRATLARLNPECTVVETSARTGAGLDDLARLLAGARRAAFPDRQEG